MRFALMPFRVSLEQQPSRSYGRIFGPNTPLTSRGYPMVPIRDVVIFPFTKVAFKIGRPGSVRALEEALAADRTIFLATQHDATVDEPRPNRFTRRHARADSAGAEAGERPDQGRRRRPRTRHDHSRREQRRRVHCDSSVARPSFVEDRRADRRARAKGRATRRATSAARARHAD